MVLCVLIDYYQCLEEPAALPQSGRVELQWKGGCGYKKKEDRDRGPEWRRLNRRKYKPLARADSKDTVGEENKEAEKQRQRKERLK